MCWAREAVQARGRTSGWRLFMKLLGDLPRSADEIEKQNVRFQHAFIVGRLPWGVLGTIVQESAAAQGCIGQQNQWTVNPKMSQPRS
jgi:hypothetical protein